MMAKWQWAALWKRAAKYNRFLYRYARDMQWRWKLKYWEKFEWARLWKATAKKWRKEAFHAQYLLSLREEAYD